MILKDTLRKIVLLQKKEIIHQQLGISRELKKLIDIKSSHILIISGIRRSGKSTLLRQIMKTLKNFYYFDFEDQRTINFQVSDFEKLDELFNEVFFSNNYFFDEIQNVSDWERFIRKKHNSKSKLIITGSNSSLLSKELGTKLTGRHLTYELFPFSYTEFLQFKNLKPSISSFKSYLNKGGFPEYLKSNNELILQQVFNDILFRDIIVRYNVKNDKIMKNLAIYLLSNIGKEFSYNKLKKLFNLGSTNTIIKYISYLENSYLIFTIPKFSYSYKKQLINAKKVYVIDSALANVNSASFSEDKGRILENIIFLHLRRKYKNIFYFQEDKECDFIIKEKEKIIQAIQVCYTLTEDNKKREIDGLIEAMTKFKLKKGLILTYDQEDKFVIDKKEIVVKSVWKYLLEKGCL